MSSEERPERLPLLRGRFTFGLKQAIVAASMGIVIAVIVAISNLS